ncbi:DUF4249 domain-containing protein [Adhaeribacter aquaticus]|uniref:DUF4249 domain-containing protein n=1 Tax=Adhaeribacter aquaticus TaxID=299567 RepID=UPI00146FB763|nr:DUF4249 domain-containing protein [Adhaeribacter aquaticus]
MKEIKLTIALVFSLLLLAGCETLVELDLPDHKPRIVVNAVFNPDSLFTVDLSSSQSVFTDHTYTPITDATIKVYKDGQYLFAVEHKGKGIYKADRKPEALKHYELQVSAPGHASIKAASYVPAAPSVRDLKATRVPATNNQSAGIQLSFVLEDEPGQENYYYIQAYAPDINPFNNQAYNRAIRIEFNKPIKYEFNMENRWFFSDKLFNGQKIPLDLFLETNQREMRHVQIAHITKKYYDYVRTLEKQSYSDNFGVMPMPVANNIEQGLGLFAGYNSVTVKILP